MRSRRYVCVAAAAQIATCAGLAMAGGADPVKDAALAAQQQQGGNAVALPNGRVIHVTPNAVLNPRVVAVPGTTVIVLTWDERLPGGAVAPMYAISLDGQRLSGRVRENVNRIDLTYASFDPLIATPGIPAELQAVAGNELFIVQFVTIPLPQFQEGVEALGGQVLRFLPENSVVVRMNAGTRAQVAALPHVRWVGAYHTAYRLSPDIAAQFISGGFDQAARYSIECMDRGPEAQGRLSAMIAGMGGTVNVTTPDQFRMEATLTPAQLLAVARTNDVNFIDPWLGPGGHDMNIVRAIGGANFLESTITATGQGVRGEVFDSELRTTHQEFTGITPLNHSPTFGNPADPHGTSVFSIVFGQGTSANARGLLPDAEEQIFYWYGACTQFGGAQTRLAANQQLVNAGGTYRAVFQTSSIGSPQITTYSTISAEVDDYLLQAPLLSTQSQSNTGNQNSRPQAWAKNIVSCGAVSHFNTLSRTDDTRTGASIGPASDGRLKPDIMFFYDLTFAADNASNVAYTEFGGTSGATPSCGGYMGLFHQMWHEGEWNGRGGASTVFLSRPYPTTAKAALCNTAFKYNWLAGGANANVTRAVQGWGMPDMQKLYNLRNKTVIVDHGESVLNPLGSASYTINVSAGEPELNVTMSYADVQGNPANQATHRVNDLSLRVTSPGGTVYWGNNGLTAGNTSTSGGVSNTKDTVENVFVASPAAGTWSVDILGDVITADTVPGTPGVNASYSLWLTGGVEGTAPPAVAGELFAADTNPDTLHKVSKATGTTTPVGSTLPAQTPGGLAYYGGRMYTIDLSGGALMEVNLATGETTSLGTSAISGWQGLAVDPTTAQLYAINQTSNNLYRIAYDGSATLVGSVGASLVGDISFDMSGQMWGLEFSPGTLIKINKANAARTAVGATGINGLQGLAFDANGTAYGTSSDTDSLYRINLTTGAATLVGAKGTDFVKGIAFARTNQGECWEDNFNRSNGPLGPNWNVISGTWAVSGNRGTHTSAAANEKIQRNGAFGFYANAHLTLDVYAPTADSQFSAVMIGLGGTTEIMVKLQNQAGAPGFSHIGIYSGSGTAFGAWAGTGTGFAALTTPGFTSARMHVSFVNADTIAVDIDTNFDGVPDQTYTKTGVSAFASQLGNGFGVAAWGTAAQFDNFKACNACWNDSFTRADGDIGGFWTPISGTWAVDGNRGNHTSANPNEILRHQVASGDYVNSEVTLDVFGPGTASQFSAVMIGLGGDTEIMVKLQNQAAAPGFSHIGIYSGSGGSYGAWAGTGTGFAALTTPGFTSARLKVYFSNPDTLVAEVDTDFNGTPNQTYTKNGVMAFADELGTGFGISAWGNTAEFDNFHACFEVPADDCYPDCNNDGVLNLADFGCFQTAFATGNMYADCNGDGVLNLADFGCFQTQFALGCP